ncbi:hypothetical protein KIK84_14315 [Curvibacter sp. CHRR-16]|uniref:pectate lyase family protein n=1 Tax=Curvibacter sp. CHRR-16 TaxID=2835872 RepID=UPI001BD9754D|nr:hypothetical protein [Curvibacter sp. CHRR-16]MBT0571499.1 hypothetical protein [Curvibacter sp. CHRR-16]
MLKLKKLSVSFIAAGIVSTAMVSAFAADATRETAPAGGWASQNGGTTGGSTAATADVYLVSTPTALLAALSNAGSRAKIVRISGTIDMTSSDNGGAFTSHSDQNVRSKIAVPSNTTIIGVGSNATIKNATINIDSVSNVIVRNLTIINPCDVAPVWDPDDGDTGNWNSEFDGLVVSNSKNVWIDHNVFTDKPLTDDKLEKGNGKIKQCHDGALDVKKGSDYVTISYNVFDSHEKNNLIGHSDSNTSDDGHLTVTFNHNYFTNVAERAPRVRFGKVHVYSNYFVGDRSASVYAYQYSIGPAYKAKIYAEQNAFQITGGSTCAHVIKSPGGSSNAGAFSDTGSLLNGSALDMSACSFSKPSWTIPYKYTPTAAANVATTVPANAGVGKITVN